jgi:rubrerythrin
MFKVNLEQVDRDGAIREAAEEAAGDNRLDFLRKAGMTGGAIVSGGAILSALAPGTALAAGTPPKSFGKGDIGILNYALTLEYLERAFYNEALSNNIVKNATLKGILDTVVRDERAHVAFLKKALGSKAAALPTFDFGDAVKSEGTFVATAFVLENTGVHAYLGQAGNIKNPAYLGAAASILTIEARHAGAIATYIDPKPTEIAPSGSFDTGYTAAKVLAAVKATGFIV